MRFTFLRQASSLSKGPGAHRLAHPFMADEGVANIPFGLELARGADRVPFVLGDDAEEIRDPHHAGAPGICAIELSSTETSLGIDRGRTTPASMQHALDAQIMNIGVRAGHLGGDVGPAQSLADEHIIVGVPQVRLRVELERELRDRR